MNSSCCSACSEAVEISEGASEPLSWFVSNSSTRRLLSRRNASVGMVPRSRLRLRLSSCNGKEECPSSLLTPALNAAALSAAERKSARLLRGASIRLPCSRSVSSCAKFVKSTSPTLHRLLPAVRLLLIREIRWMHRELPT
jgi:hypothetical protein